MAYQTPYADIPLNTRAIANYNNPIFDVLRNGLGWLENQEQKIADRKKFELLRQIQDDDSMVDKYTQARNANEDLAKQLYGNSYFVNSDDADLAKAMEALKIRESNKMLDTLGRDIASKVNQDVYKAGNEQELLSSLGFNNRTQDELNKVKDFAQKQLKDRYEPYIQGKLADREVEEGKVAESDIDNLVEEFKNKYGMDINPANLYNTANRKDYRQAAVNSRIAQAHKQVLNKTVSPEDVINYLYMLQGVNPENTVEISNAIANFNKIKSKGYTDTATQLLRDSVEFVRDDSSDGTIDYTKVRQLFMKMLTDNRVPLEYGMQVLNTYVKSDGSLNTKYLNMKKRYSAAQTALKSFDESPIGKKYKEFSLENSAMKDIDYTQMNSIFNRARGTDNTISDSDFQPFLAYLHAIGKPIPKNVSDKDIQNFIKNALPGFKKFKAERESLVNEANKLRLLMDDMDLTGSMFEGGYSEGGYNG